MADDIRLEHDALGEVAVPANRLWGAQTQRSLQHFDIGRERFRWSRPVIRALGLVKQAAAMANAELGELDEARAVLIQRAASEVVAGTWDDEFPLVVFQTGSGTQTNMNANEVIATRAGHLAARTSDACSACTRTITSTRASRRTTPSRPSCTWPRRSSSCSGWCPPCRPCATLLDAKASAFDDVVMIGRTHLQDATPITLGQVIGGWVSQIDVGLCEVRHAFEGLLELPLSATAVGTGLNAHPEFGARAAAHLAALTGLAFRPAPSGVAALSAHDRMAVASAALRLLSGALMKMANDVRLYASGPRAGIGELRIPENEPGSSIMPGKVNPTQSEALTMVAVQVHGNDHAVAFANTQGQFQLNVFKPVILHNVLESIALLSDASRMFDQHCAQGIEPDRERIAAHVSDSLMLVTALAPHIGYEHAAAIALAAHRQGLSLREAAIASGHLTAENFDAWVVPAAMAKPHGNPSEF
ncbi:MAG: class II fumarate hydratase [Vicinamibacterales bacterium]